MKNPKKSTFPPNQFFLKKDGELPEDLKLFLDKRMEESKTSKLITIEELKQRIKVKYGI